MYLSAKDMAARPHTGSGRKAFKQLGSDCVFRICQKVAKPPQCPENMVCWGGPVTLPISKGEGIGLAQAWGRSA